MGIKHFVLAVNKMDLIDYDSHRFNEIKAEFKSLCANFELDSVKVIPVSATKGDNLTKLSIKTPWYEGKPMLSYLEQIDVAPKADDEGFVMPVQRVCRPNHTFRGFMGR